MDQLNVSTQLTTESRAIGAAPFLALEAVVQANIAARVLRDYPVALITAAMASLVEMTIAFMAAHPSQAAMWRHQGFDLFWHGIALD